jgi:hypothetical protein
MVKKLNKCINCKKKHITDAARLKCRNKHTRIIVKSVKSINNSHKRKLEDGEKYEVKIE